MATAAKPTTIRINETDKRLATEILDSLGITLNSYLNMAVKQLVNKRRVPFELDAPRDIPNDETRMALAIAEAKELGIIADDSPAFFDADEALAYLESE